MPTIRKTIVAAVTIFATTMPIASYAEELGTAKFEYATGKSSQTDGIDDRDLSGDYTYYKYGASATAEPTKGYKYRAGYRNYKKDFEPAYKNLNVIVNTANTSLSFPLYKTDRISFSSTTDYDLRTKRYKNNHPAEYDENSLGTGIGIDYGDFMSLELSGGFKDYDYINRDSYKILKTFFKAAPEIKVLDERLTLGGYFKKQWVDQASNKKDYTEDTTSVRASFKTELPIFYKTSGRYEQGRSDTRDFDEDREDTLRFVYHLWDASAYFKLTKDLEDQFTYGNVYREYITSMNGYEGWFIKDKLDYDLFKKDNYKGGISINGEHKEMDFPHNDARDYIKNVIGAGFTIAKKDDWSLKPGFSLTKYQYAPMSTSTQNTYKLDILLKKNIWSKDDGVEVGYVYKWKDYKYRSDVRQWGLNVSYNVKF